MRLEFQEPFPYHPHITLAQEIEHKDVPRLHELAIQRWQEFRGPRSFRAERAVFVQNTHDRVWVDLASYSLGAGCGSIKGEKFRSRNRLKVCLPAPICLPGPCVAAEARAKGELLDTIAVCDTEPIAIEGLRSLLEPLTGLCVISAETSLSEGLDSLRELRPSMFVLDAAFGVHAVKDALRTARDSGAAPIVWGSLISESESIRLIQTGASAVIRKNCSLDNLVECLRSVASGGTWMDGKLFPEMGSDMHPGHSPLTAREQEVMNLVERGMKNREIADALGIRTGTVKIHLKHIFEKTGIRGRYGLALSALRGKGLLSEVV